MSRAQVRTMRSDGTGMRWLGELGAVSGLSWASTMPGGYDQMNCTLWQPPTFRTDAMDPGRVVQILYGGSVIWDGKLNEPQPSATNGWTITAHGAGTFGTDFQAIYSSWLNQNDAVNQAITRGLRWVNPGGNSIPSSVWLGQQIDSAAQSIADMLNLMCSRGALTWLVGRNNVLTVKPIPTAPTRLLIVNDPVPRTVAGDINTLYVRFQVSADSATTASFAFATATNAASVAQHGPMEAYIDISSAGTMTFAAAQAVGTAVLAKYVRASFQGPFTAHYGDLRTLGGQPVDLGAELAGEVIQLVISDAGYGGEVAPGPVTFPVGQYNYDEDSDTLQITPFQNVNLSMSGLLGAAALINTGTTGFGSGTAAFEQFWTNVIHAPGGGHGAVYHGP